MTAPLINGRYELKDTLGQGGMGIVYRAYDTATRRDVALKTMHDAANPVAVELFSKEWSVLATLSHPNIVDILDRGEFESKGQRRPFFVMPLLPGKTLDQLIHSSVQRLTLARIVEILNQTCRGLQAAHERGLIHRDLKPSNIFVMGDDTAKIIDFGVVHLAGSQSITGLKGTVQYMAPEQLDLKPTTAQSDIFSLGVIAYEALTGRKPFARKTEPDTAEAVRFHIPPPASEINPTAGDQISRVVHKAMAKQPWNRFASAREFGEALERALRGEIVFDNSKIRPRIERASKAFREGDLQFAADILNELEAEGNIEPEMSVLRLQIEQAGQQRTIRQLLESARTRMEQEEYPLALQKVQEILRLDAGNTEALGMREEIEKARSEKQIENWMRLAREHLDRGNFSEARQGLEEALKLNANDTRIKQLLADLSRQERENSKARLQKEQLYEQARQAFQNGEISTALSKLEQILELNRSVPDRTLPERDALYQNFYNQVRSENDANRIAYEQARRLLSEKDFAKARALCDENLLKYPNQALFQALKLEIVERERQELYAYIAEIERRLDAEPDLDRKLSIAREAAERYPQEPQFRQSLKLVRERRDLVLGIVAKARQYEERAQFAEAISQWEILRGIYPQYPGLAFEIDQLKRRREQQAREEIKARWVEQTDAALTSGDFERARDLAIQALAEFPADAELTGLEQLANQRIERKQQAQHLLEQGDQLCRSNRFDEGLPLLREAAKLDPQNSAVSAALINALIRRAEEMVSKGEWATAEPFIQSALELDAANSIAKAIRAQIQDEKRRYAVDNCLAEARRLRSQGDYRAATAKVDAVLRTYPFEQRLSQFRASLEKDESELQFRKQRSDDLLELRSLCERAQHSDDATMLDSILAQSMVFSERYTGDYEFDALRQTIQQGAALFLNAPEAHAQAEPAIECGHVSGSLQMADSLSVVALPETEIDNSFSQQNANSRRRGITSNGVPPQHPGPKDDASANFAAPRALEPAVPARRPGLLKLLWGAAILLLLAIAVAVGVRELSFKPPEPVRPKLPPSTPVMYLVPLSTSVPSARVQVDGRPALRPLHLSAGNHTLEISAPGYRTLTQSIAVGPNMTPVAITLLPELPQIYIYSPEQPAHVLVDGKQAGALQSGVFSKDDLAFGEHTIMVTGGAGEVLRLRFSGAAAQPPRLLDPVKNNVVVIAAFGPAGTVYSGSKLLLQTKDGRLQPVPREGLPVAAPGDLVLTDGKRQQTLSLTFGNHPQLSIYVIGEMDTRPLLSISTNVEGGQLFVNGEAVTWSEYKGKLRGRLEPGDYTIRLEKSGYQPAQTQLTLARGDKKAVEMNLSSLPVFGSLEIEGGIAGTEVLIDRLTKGTLDSNGKLSVSQLAPGAHTISFRKENYEGRQYVKTLKAAQTLHIGAAEARLLPFGSLTFHVVPADAAVSYKRSDESDWHPTENNRTVAVHEGHYVVRGISKSNTSKEQSYYVAPGDNAVINLQIESARALVPAVRKLSPLEEVEDPSKWRTEGELISFQGQGFGWIRSPQGRFSVDFRKKSGGFFGRSTIFVVGFAGDGRYKVEYRLSKDGWLSRKISDGNRTDDSPRAERVDGDDYYRLLITIEPHRVLVRSAGGAVLDDCPTTFDLTAGKFGFKSGFQGQVVRLRSTSE